MMGEDYLWVEKYRPKTVKETILPVALKKTFQSFVDNKNVPNLILHGKSGTGKTTVARAMLEELDCDYIVINSSLDRNIDTLRNEIMSFASSLSLHGGRKYVILDEADYLNPNSTQPALRNFIEEFAKNCGFILTCNYVNKLLPSIHSRCSLVEFKIPNNEKVSLATEFMNRVCEILNAEKVPFDKAAVAETIQKYFPDWRRVLNELQRYAGTGKIDTGILANVKAATFKALVEFMKAKNFTAVRKWVGENSDVESEAFFRSFYDNASEYFETVSIPQVILILADYQYKAAFVADKEINTVACLAEIMVNGQFK